MKTKIQIKTFWGKLLFEFEKENNSIKDTIQEAVKQGADLRGAELRGADLRGADLQGAELRGADLRGADLRGADLRGADLQGSDLWGADLRGAELKRIYTTNCILPEGELIVWKKLKDDLIAKLTIPVKAKRVHAIGSRKCRFEYAKVEAIYNGSKKVKTGISIYNDTPYEVGKIVAPDKFNDSPLIECSNGIHAFITKQEAKDYNL